MGSDGLGRVRGERHHTKQRHYDKGYDDSHAAPAIGAARHYFRKRA